LNRSFGTKRYLLLATFATAALAIISKNKLATGLSCYHYGSRFSLYICT